MGDAIDGEAEGDEGAVPQRAVPDVAQGSQRRGVHQLPG